MISRNGILLRKYFLDVSQDEQRRRFEARIKDPVKHWKLSPINTESVRRWWDYTAAYQRMIKATHTPEAPWHIVPADDKRRARLNLIRHLLDSIPYKKVSIDLPKIRRRKRSQGCHRRPERGPPNPQSLLSNAALDLLHRRRETARVRRSRRLDAAAAAAKGVHFVDEDDAGQGVLARARRGRVRGSGADEHLDELGARRSRRRHTCSAGDGARQHVLPVPGGPTSRTPLGMRAPSRPNDVGSRRKATTSCSSNFASSTPEAAETLAFRSR